MFSEIISIILLVKVKIYGLQNKIAVCYTIRNAVFYASLMSKTSMCYKEIKEDIKFDVSFLEHLRAVKYG